jgi:hypothetical protein
MDIDARSRAHEALRRSERDLRLIFDGRTGRISRTE